MKPQMIPPNPVPTVSPPVAKNMRPKMAKSMPKNIHSGWDDFVKLMEARLPFAIIAVETMFPSECFTEVPISSHFTSSVQLLPSAEIVAPSVRVILLSMIR